MVILMSTAFHPDNMLFLSRISDICLSVHITFPCFGFKVDSFKLTSVVVASPSFAGYFNNSLVIQSVKYSLNAKIFVKHGAPTFFSHL